jgi:hypothetical protein
MDVVFICHNMSNIKCTFSATFFEEVEEKRFLYRMKLKTNSYGRSIPIGLSNLQSQSGPVNGRR